MSYSYLDSTLSCKCSLLQCGHTLPTFIRTRSTLDAGKNISETRGCALKEPELCERHQYADPLPVFLEAGTLSPPHSLSRRYADCRVQTAEVALDVILGYVIVILT